jgi:hypothetical protein
MELLPEVCGSGGVERERDQRHDLPRERTKGII